MTTDEKTLIRIMQVEVYRECVEEQLHGNWQVSEDDALDAVARRKAIVTIRKRRGCTPRETAAELAGREGLKALERIKHG